MVTLVGYILLGLVMEMPEFGSPNSPSYTHTIPRFFENSLEDTGAINMVTSIILDYRAFDTLGEATVLFTAAIAILSLTGEEE
jgi:multicomponent Na+:H+ antiporter subunit B